ncbi:sigma-70 family RNA polymerase sigma factor [Acidimicrobiaceae bacterium USS-CC1]|uniref:Sigma-70 family RNA polymerase sigma factor n=1 Tax=Acidiferrimicrobium australe TaxID=2664430 RepID=A0ABW9QNZ2_9ACTN|nr:sigma-70 family RNA polymerase sigma factor [Acidiferrimicrobium australe]
MTATATSWWTSEDPAEESGPMSDWAVGAVARRASTGDEEAWRELVRRFDGMIGAVGRRYGLSPADVGELRQTVWLRLVEHLVRIEDPQRVAGWLATTARHESLHMIARASRHTFGVDEILGNTADPAAPDVDARSLAADETAALRAAWKKLPPRCQRLLAHLMADDAPGYRDLSRCLEMPVGSIGPTRGRCIEHLRRLVAMEG